MTKTVHHKGVHFGVKIANSLKWNACWSACMIAMVGAVVLGAVSCVPSPFSPRNHDFGIARQGSEIYHTFVYVNDTDKDVRLSAVKSSCGCTIIDVKPNELITPGATLPVPVALDLSGKSGNVSTSIGLVFDDPALNVDYTLHGAVFDEHPSTMDFGNIKPGSGEQRSFVLKPFPGQPPVEVLTLETQPEYGMVTHVPDLVDKRAQRITFVLSNDLPPGYFKIPLAVLTNDTEAPKKVVWVTGYVLSDLDLTRREVVFGRIGSTENKSQLIDLWSPEGKPVGLVRVENTREDVFAHEVILQTDRDRQPIRISLTGTIPADEKSGIVKGVITFWADVGGVEKKDRVEVYASL